MSDKKIRKLVYCALLAALTCVATLVIQIPAPVSGYVNLGDCVVLLSAFFLGPWYGAAAAGIGSMLADLLSGFAIYAPGTLVIKAVMAIAAALLYRALPMKHSLVRAAIGGTVAEIIMIAGYLLYGALLMDSFAASLAGVPGNAVQGGVGLVLGVLLTEVLKKTPLWDKI